MSMSMMNTLTTQNGTNIRFFHITGCCGAMVVVMSLRSEQEFVVAYVGVRCSGCRLSSGASECIKWN